MTCSPCPQLLSGSRHWSAQWSLGDARWGTAVTHCLLHMSPAGCLPGVTHPRQRHLGFGHWAFLGLRRLLAFLGLSAHSLRFLSPLSGVLGFSVPELILLAPLVEATPSACCRPPPFPGPDLPRPGSGACSSPVTSSHCPWAGSWVWMPSPWKAAGLASMAPSGSSWWPAAPGSCRRPCWASMSRDLGCHVVPRTTCAVRGEVGRGTAGSGCRCEHRCR